MVVNAEKIGDGLTVKTENDNRITKVGEKVITGGKVYLRPILKKDITFLNEWKNDEETYQFLGGGFMPTSIDQQEKWMESMIDTTGSNKRFIICDNGNKPVGMVGLYSINWVHRTCEIGVYIGDKNSKGNGYGKEACMLIEQFAREYLNLRKIKLYVVYENDAATHLWKNLGYQEIGQFKDERFIKEDRGLYTDLLRQFRDDDHKVHVVSPREKRLNKPTEFVNEQNVQFLRVKIGNITKTNIVEKGISTLRIESLFLKAIRKYLNDIKFDLVIYSTPPITFERNNENNKEVYFVIAGSGTEFNKLKKYFEISQPINAQLFAQLPKEDYEVLANSSDAGLIFLDKRFTIPNFPSRLLSYMQASMPVLAATDTNTDIGQVIEHGEFGLWCMSNDVEEFNKKVQQLCDKELRQRMGENARNYLEENYTAKHSYEIIMNHFN
uniref:N-acetyltransferase domain-containing protein n=1 Tax=Batrachochytrium dendrobatidis (strain JAM81 / FGSC 10211) TaxID=684364 RepID=F4PFA6_BATDJ|eukprot:XP_006683289.1 hypothetical protein BATDEDRAFT_93055 [Batrachochytrium dendrobatidis JAM81]